MVRLTGRFNRALPVDLTELCERLASAGEDKRLMVWELGDGSCVACWDADCPIRCCAVSSLGRIVSGDVRFLELVDHIEAPAPAN